MNSLSIIDNPICQLGASILRSYVIAVMSSTFPSLSPPTPISSPTPLACFNEMEITSSDRERAGQLFRTLLLITNRRLKSQQLSIDQHLFTLCHPTIDFVPTHPPLQHSASTPLLSSSQSSDIIPEFFRNTSRSGSLCLIDPLISPLIAKGSSTVFPNVANRTSNTTAGTGEGVGGVIETAKRTDLEYRYPYKSFIPSGERAGGVVIANQNIYSMNLGTNVLLTSPTLVQDMVQVVLTRRKIEEKFNSVCFTPLTGSPSLLPLNFFSPLVLWCLVGPPQIR